MIMINNQSSPSQSYQTSLHSQSTQYQNSSIIPQSSSIQQALYNSVPQIFQGTSHHSHQLQQQQQALQNFQLNTASNINKGGTSNMASSNGANNLIQLMNGANNQSSLALNSTTSSINANGNVNAANNGNLLLQSLLLSTLQQQKQQNNQNQPQSQVINQGGFYQQQNLQASSQLNSNLQNQNINGMSIEGVINGARYAQNNNQNGSNNNLQPSQVFQNGSFFPNNQVLSSNVVPNANQFHANHNAVQQNFSVSSLIKQQNMADQFQDANSINGLLNAAAKMNASIVQQNNSQFSSANINGNNNIQSQIVLNPQISQLNQTQKLQYQQIQAQQKPIQQQQHEQTNQNVLNILQNISKVQQANKQNQQQAQVNHQQINQQRTQVQVSIQNQKNQNLINKSQIPSPNSQNRRNQKYEAKNSSPQDINKQMNHLQVPQQRSNFSNQGNNRSQFVSPKDGYILGKKRPSPYNSSSEDNSQYKRPRTQEEIMKQKEQQLIRLSQMAFSTQQSDVSRGKIYIPTMPKIDLNKSKSQVNDVSHQSYQQQQLFGRDLL
ncbi:UNKNOWN [Stylonychia lemnae]|uniref:Uncharacterized protein n=1 Tax=Stylonychia lemnae TaxID=5949 RepID=A0A078AZ01_STYLE|nr:UNKNOWN [Stylonychia lemnae]|eukprot:CDW87675.1 UNKNOWN [Stylonychia lemnae]